MIKVNASKRIKKLHNFWSNIHFHPTDAIEDDWGREILDRVSSDGAAKTVRMYAMLEDIVSRDEQGKLQYDYTLNDQRIDYMLDKGFNLLICYCFIPLCLTDDAQLSSVSVGSTRYKGKMICTSKPNDYGEWEEVCYQYTKHIVDRYGLEEVKKWYLQCYNEPDHGGFFLSGLGWGEGTYEKRIEAYLPLYTRFATAVERVSKELKFGGPTTTSGASLPFFEAFLSYLKESGTRCDYLCSHNYGNSYDSVDKGAPIDTVYIADKNKRYLDLIHKYFPEGKELVIDEWGAFNRGFKGLESHPCYEIREHSGYAAFMGKMIVEILDAEQNVSKMLICLSGQHDMAIEFGGRRSLFTKSGIEKPIYYAYYLTSKLGDNRLEACTDNDSLKVLATESEEGKLSILLSYSHPNFVYGGAPLSDTVRVEGIEGDYRLTRWLVDKDHACAYTAYKEENMSENPTAEQIAYLREKAKLEPETDHISANGNADIPVSATPNALILLELEKM